MGTAVVLAVGPRLLLVEAPGGRTLERAPLDRDVERAAARWLELRPADVPTGLVDAIARLPPSTQPLVGEPVLTGPLGVRVGRALPAASLAEVRAARAAAWTEPPPEARPFALALARRALERALRSPEEVLVALAREEERLERALGREERAAAAFVPVPETPLAEYEAAWAQAREVLVAHHAGLERLLAESVRRLTPNLSGVVGEKVAARLVAAAGGLAPLARMTAARVQLLGSRRRPSPERGPRFGVLYRGARMEDVPAGRRGAYARSLAALAVIAARADSATGRSLVGPLVARRDRRVEALRRSRR